jgi:hypothetical protein
MAVIVTEFLSLGEHNKRACCVSLDRTAGLPIKCYRAHDEFHSLAISMKICKITGSSSFEEKVLDPSKKADEKLLNVALHGLCNHISVPGSEEQPCWIEAYGVSHGH